MDFRKFGIDERLLRGADALRDRALFHEKMLVLAVEKGENVCARLELSEGREAVYLLPAIDWLAKVSEGEARRVLFVGPDRSMCETVALKARTIGAGLGLDVCVVTPAEESEGIGGAAAPVLEGNLGASFVAGTPDALLSASETDLIHLRDFAYLVVDGGERLAELPDELIHRFSAALRLSGERKTIFVCAKLSPKAKSLAWDLADNPVDLHIEEEVAKGQSVQSETWQVPAESKVRFVLGLAARTGSEPICVFCNLKSGAEELALRLRHNGVAVDYILGGLPEERKAAILRSVVGGERSPGPSNRVLVLTDEGTIGLARGTFRLLVNFDIPLEPDLYVKRLEMLDRFFPEAKVINLACERYLVGLSAVERYIGASLEAKPVADTLIQTEDLSAGFAFERPNSDRGGPRRGSKAGRLVPASTGRQSGEDVRRDDIRRGDSVGNGKPESRSDVRGTPRSDDKGERARGDSRRDPRRERERTDAGRDDRSPDIRRSIADATGGSLDIDELGSRTSNEGLTSDRGPKSVESRRTKRGGSEGKREKSHGSDKDKPFAFRENFGKGIARRGRYEARTVPAQGSPVKGTQPISSAELSSNPYDVPMEERMRLYREKYGKRLDENAGQYEGSKGRTDARDNSSRGPNGQKTNNTSGKGRADSNRNRNSPPGARNGAREGDNSPGNLKSRHNGEGQGFQGKNTTSPSTRNERLKKNEAQQAVPPQANSPKEGFLGRLLKIFKKEKD